MGRDDYQNSAPSGIDKGEIENLRYALGVISNYSNYLFQRAWGTVFILWGVLFPASFLLFLKSEEISDALGLGSPSVVAAFAGIFSLLIPAVTLYSFGSATLLASRREKMNLRRDAPHVLAVSATYMLAFLLAGADFSGLGVLSYLIAIGAANILSFLILMVAHGRRYMEILISGAGLVLASLPLATVGDAVVRQWLSLAALGICFILAGIYGRLAAARILAQSKG
jgi:O-antigen/teichoic acid export membrane protein